MAGANRLEHRAIIEGVLGRELLASEVVHHVNGNTFDNRPENLEVLSHQAHSAHHNQKHPLSKPCVTCGVTFTPHATKRARAQTCGPQCKRELLKLRNAQHRIIAEMAGAR